MRTISWSPPNPLTSYNSLVWGGSRLNFTRKSILYRMSSLATWKITNRDKYGYCCQSWQICKSRESHSRRVVDDFYVRRKWHRRADIRTILALGIHIEIRLLWRVARTRQVVFTRSLICEYLAIKRPKVWISIWIADGNSCKWNRQIGGAYVVRTKEIFINSIKRVLATLWFFSAKREIIFDHGCRSVMLLSEH